MSTFIRSSYPSFPIPSFIRFNSASEIRFIILKYLAETSAISLTFSICSIKCASTFSLFAFISFLVFVIIFKTIHKPYRIAEIQQRGHRHP